MRPPMWIVQGAARASEKRRWAALTEEEQAKECGVTLEVYRETCKGAKALGQGLIRGLDEAMARVLKAKVKP